MLKFRKALETNFHTQAIKKISSLTPKRVLILELDVILNTYEKISNLIKKNHFSSSNTWNIFRKWHIYKTNEKENA